MEKRRVIFSPEAAVDLSKPYEYIARQSGPTRAINYIGRIEHYCAGLKFSPERGTRRDDLRPSLRIAGFERRITIAFHLQLQAIVIDRILYAGRDVKREFRKPRRKRRSANP